MPSVVDEIVARQMANLPIKPKNPDGYITQGNWFDFNPVFRAMLGGLSEMIGAAPSARVVDRLAELKSPVLRPQTPFGWADYGAGLTADLAQTGLAGADLAALAPMVGRRAGQSLMNELGQVDVWHGSPHRFDKVSHEKIGTGEGAQAFGWGTYYTDKKDIAAHYRDAANQMAWKIDGQVYHGLTSRLDAKEGNFAANALDRFNGDIDKAISWLQDYGNEGAAKGFLRRMKRKGASIEKAEGNIYRAQLFPGKDPSEYTFLDWYPPPSNEFINKIKSQAEKEGLKFESLTGNGHTVYAKIADVLGSDKEASLFLKRAGIDGIRYPTETLSGKGTKGGGAYNYVVFDENDIRLVSRESGGVVEDLFKKEK